MPNTLARTTASAQEERANGEEHAVAALRSSPSPWSDAEERRAYQADASAAATASPARAIQQALSEEFAVADEDRWSPRRTVAFVFTSCGAFWMTVYFAVAAMIG